MAKKSFLVSLLAALGLMLVSASVQAAPDINRVRAARNVHEIICERLSTHWLFSPACSDEEPPPPPECGNGVVETGEQCDGSAPSGYTCNNQCELVIEEPAAECGNNIVEAGEHCDGSAPTGFTCTQQCLLEELPAEPQVVSYGYASLLASEVVPPVDEDGLGTAVFWLDSDNNLNYEVTVTGLTGPISGVQLRGPADRTQTANVLEDITGSFSGFHAEGVWPVLNLTELGYLLSDEIYLSVQTEAYPEGELRGQVHLDEVGIALLRTGAEVPPVEGEATATGFFRWNDETTDLWFHMTATGLSGPITVAHFHGPAEADATADPIFNLTFYVDGEHVEGEWHGVSQQHRNFLTSGLAYVNLHTEVNPAGELRGQVVGLPSPSVVTQQLVINEVYADVDAEHGEETVNEWIELYNNGSEAVDLLDWIIDDSEESPDIIQESAVVAPGEFALISQATSTFETFWASDIPAGTHLLVLGSPIGSGLANGGDALLLKSGDGIMDAMSYGNDTSIFNLSAAAAGQSLSRQPNGQDTGTASDWTVLETPTPGY